MTLVLFIDELQYIYPEPNSEMDEKELDEKVEFIKDICSLAGGVNSLIIAACSSVTLVDKAFHKISSDKQFGRYPKLNDQKGSNNSFTNY